MMGTPIPSSHLKGNHVGYATVISKGLSWLISIHEPAKEVNDTMYQVNKPKCPHKRHQVKTLRDHSYLGLKPQIFGMKSWVLIMMNYMRHNKMLLWWGFSALIHHQWIDYKPLEFRPTTEYQHWRLHVVYSQSYRGPQDSCQGSSHIDWTHCVYPG